MELLYHSATSDGSTNAIPIYIGHANNSDPDEFFVIRMYAFG
jgi:hypothetical protein